MEEIRIAIAVPARLKSERLPNKVLADINGKTMLQRVLDRCLKSNVSKVLLCTDSYELKELANDWGYQAIITSPNCTSGTDRIASVLQEIISATWNKIKIDSDEYEKLLEKTIIINVQADQPFVEPSLINNL